MLATLLSQAFRCKRVPASAHRTIKMVIGDLLASSLTSPSIQATATPVNFSWRSASAPPLRLAHMEGQSISSTPNIIRANDGHVCGTRRPMSQPCHQTVLCHARHLSSAADAQVEKGESKPSECSGGKVRARGRPKAVGKVETAETTTRRKLSALPIQAFQAEGMDAETSEELDALLVSDVDPEPVVFGPDSVVLGVDPDVNGALAVLRGPVEETTAQILDVPVVRVKIGATMRRRHDPGTMAALLRQLQLPPGTVVYIEQPRPMPLDGKQGWYSAGYGFGVWMGVLHALQLRVVPVHPANWKRALGLAGRGFTKDDSRELALRTFPALVKELKRKKDHGRAEALLIAQHGRMLAANLEPLQHVRHAANDAPTHSEAVILASV